MNEINEQDFCVVKFGADWCQPCKQLDNTIKEIQNEEDFTHTVYTLNVEDHQQESVNLGIRTIPTTIIMSKGVPIDRRIGNVKKEEFKEWVEETYKNKK